MQTKTDLRQLPLTENPQKGQVESGFPRKDCKCPGVGALGPADGWLIILATVRLSSSVSVPLCIG